ncbi:tagaturonate reductase [Alicyclobacillaceae bacterium I2511]|nr:tagaturonate reductase [Alicyclobacillaceae bacterium I2511]
MLLCREWMGRQSNLPSVENYPERFLQFGEGNFMKGFVDWLIHQWNKSGQNQGRTVVVTPLAAGAQAIQKFKDQEGLYTVWLRGIQNGELVDTKEVVTSVSRAIDPYQDWNELLECARQPLLDTVFSNTTEAGLTYLEEPLTGGQCPTSFPGKLTAYLYERYQTFGGDSSMGLDIVPCELVDNNGDRLRELVLQYIADWRLPEQFAKWVEQSNFFYNTLVDSIITGFASMDKKVLAEEFPYVDSLGVVREPFYLWVIEGPARLSEKLNFPAAQLNVRYVPDATPYRLIKVKVLNGAHTSLAGLAYLAGLQTVKEVVTHPVLGTFVQRLMQYEILPTLPAHGIPALAAQEFANSVMERFSNPYLRHEITSLQLNGLSKIGVRVLPILHDSFVATGKIPPLLTMALAGLLLYYRNATAPNERWVIKDNIEQVQAVQAAWELEPSAGLDAAIQAILRLQRVWGQDLSKLPGLAKTLVNDVVQIRSAGVIHALSELMSVKA